MGVRIGVEDEPNWESFPCSCSYLTHWSMKIHMLGRFVIPEFITLRQVQLIWVENIQLRVKFGTWMLFQLRVKSETWMLFQLWVEFKTWMLFQLRVKFETWMLFQLRVKFETWMLFQLRVKFEIWMLFQTLKLWNLELDNGTRHYSNSRRSHRRCSVEKGTLKNFENFTGKHLCWTLF